MRTSTSTGKTRDHFSGHASLYANTRPGYPEELFRMLAAMSPGTRCAWDCATGNGQAARSLAEYFDTVYATDVSLEQIRQAGQTDGLHYHVAKAEASAILDREIDLVVVAQALHWFDLEGFTDEVRRVLRKDGVLAVWCYPRVQVDAAVDEVVTRFYRDTVGPYWPAERRLVENGYRTLGLPIVEQALPPLSIELEWDLTCFGQYIRSWSATQRYMKAHGRDPVDEFVESVRDAWGCATERRRVYWPLSVRAGRLT